MIKGLAPQIDLSSTHYNVASDGNMDKIYGRGTFVDPVVFPNVCD